MMKAKGCSNCGNAKYILNDNDWECKLSLEKIKECAANFFDKHWVKKLKKDVTDDEYIEEQVAKIVYNQGKAKIFNLLESQITEDRKLTSCQKIARDIIKKITEDVLAFVKEVKTGAMKQ